MEPQRITGLGRDNRTRKRGVCGRCGKELRLAKGDLLPAHRVGNRESRYCAGSGQPPRIQGPTPSGMMACPAPSEGERFARREALDSRVRRDLRKAAWEASQVLSCDEIRGYVEATIAEIVSDEP